MELMSVACTAITSPNDSLKKCIKQEKKIMKVCIVQPPYSTDFSQSEKYFRWEMEAFDKCDETMDLIVFPEAADTPCMAHSAKDVHESMNKYADAIFQKATERQNVAMPLSFLTDMKKRRMSIITPHLPLTEAVILSENTENST